MMINNETLLLFIFIVLFIMQLLTTVASFVLLIKFIKTHSANNSKINESFSQKESDIQIGMPQEVGAELSSVNVFAEAMTLDSLDSFDELEHTESDPDRLLKILECGLPDEELEEIMKKLEKD